MNNFPKIGKILHFIRHVFYQSNIKYVEGAGGTSNESTRKQLAVNGKTS